MLTVVPIPAFTDNYIWMIQLQGSNRVMVVDPGEAAPVVAMLDEQQLMLEGIIVTHHHWDHVGGIDELLKRTQVPVYGPANPAIEQITQRLTEGDQIDVFGETFKVLEVPGHTLDHIAYYSETTAQSETAAQPLLFCGDTLFSAGCGRLFEGSAEQMYDSLTKLTKLSASTAVFPTHEYTLANLEFANAVEAANPDLQRYRSWCVKQRESDLPTLPTSIANELAVNPFLRSTQAAVQQQVARHSGETLTTPVEVFRHTRLWKDQF